MDTKTLVLVIDIIGVTAGLLSVGVILSASKKIGGQVGSTFGLVLAGIFFQMAAIIYTIVFTRLKLFPAPAVDVHHALMTIGLILFVWAAKKFSELSS